MKNKLLTGLVVWSLSSAVLAAEGTTEGKPDGYIERAQFTSGIENREPVDLVTVLENDQDQIHFFSDIRQMSGRTVTHRWEYQGQVMAEIDFEVGGPRWRVHSSKTLLPTQLGKWTVVVVDQSGWPMHAEMFEYRQAASEPVEALMPEVSIEDTEAGQLEDAPMDENMSDSQTINRDAEPAMETPQPPAGLELQE